VGIFFPLSHEKQAKKIVSNCNKKYTNDDLKNKNPQCTSQIRKWGVVSRVQSIKKGKLKPSSPNC
jgi:PHP family Zn ribbon phosphoesterase